MLNNIPLPNTMSCLSDDFFKLMDARMPTMV